MHLVYPLLYLNTKQNKMVLGDQKGYINVRHMFDEGTLLVVDEGPLLVVH